MTKVKQFCLVKTIWSSTVLFVSWVEFEDYLIEKDENLD